MRVLVVSNGAPFILSHRLPLMSALRDEFDLHIAAPPSKAGARLKELGFSFHTIALDRKGTNARKELATLAGFIRLYSHLRPDLVHHLTIKPVIYGTIAARISRVPAVVNAVTGRGSVFLERGSRAAMLRQTVRSAYRLALRHRNSRVIFQNPDDLDMFVDAGLVPAKDAMLIRGSGVETDVFVPTPEPAGPPVVVLAGRMIWQKGVREFVDAAHILRREGVSARLVLCGDADPDNPSGVPRKTLDDWAASGVVEWWGHRDDMTAVLAATNVVCLPSYAEGVPKVLIEAASCARAVIASDVPGCREIVRHQQNGLLVPVRDSAKLADAIRTLVAAPSLRAEMGRRGRTIAVNEFGTQKVIMETVAAYRALALTS